MEDRQVIRDRVKYINEIFGRDNFMEIREFGDGGVVFVIDNRRYNTCANVDEAFCFLNGFEEAMEITYKK